MYTHTHRRVTSRFHAKKNNGGRHRKNVYRYMGIFNFPQHSHPHTDTHIHTVTLLTQYPPSTTDQPQATPQVMASSSLGGAGAAQISISCLTNKLTLQQPAAEGKEQHHLTKTVLTIISSATNAGPVALKIRTTRPKRYLVRPNHGMLAPGEKLEVSIIMSAEKQSEALEEVTISLPSAYTDKFQVVYVGVEKSLYVSLGKSADAQEQVRHIKIRKEYICISIFYPFSGAFSYIFGIPRRTNCSNFGTM